tara:strand:+ start:130 stop:573 length:444 start_codon:yes stop_codon:yes gene_type:complete
MSWLVTAIVGSTALKVGSEINKGKALKAQAGREATQMELDRQLTAVEAQQRNNDRLTEYQDARSSNDAWFAFLGRDTSDLSVKAFLEKQQRVAFDDVARSSLQSRMQQAKLSMQIQDVRISGRNAEKAGYINAATTVLSGLYTYKAN